MVPTPLVLVALVLGACSGPVAATPTPTATGIATTVSPAASPTAAPRSYVIAVRSDLGTVLFLRADGSTAGRASLPSYTVAVTAAAGRLWYMDDAGHVRAVGVDGLPSDMGVAQSLAAPGPIATGLAVSGDGRRWAWGVCAGCVSSGGRARIYLGGIEAPEKLVADEPSSNPVLIPLAFTARGVVVARSASGFGGCCYFNPEMGHKDVFIVDPATMRAGPNWNGCASAYATPKGSFACTGSVVTVQLADGSTRTVTPTAPVVAVGWAHVDDSGGRVVFTAVHSRGQGDGGCPCTLDTEAGTLGAGSVTRLADQMTLDDLLPDGRIIATSAPVVPGQGASAEWIVAPDGSRVRLGPDGARFLAVVPLP
jgi:hypothetical protein